MDKDKLSYDPGEGESATDWWLIHHNDWNVIRRALEHGLAWESALDNAGLDMECDFRDALHRLESGLHRTDAVPADFEEE